MNPMNKTFFPNENGLHNLRTKIALAERQEKEEIIFIKTMTTTLALAIGLFLVADPSAREASAMMVQVKCAALTEKQNMKNCEDIFSSRGPVTLVGKDSGVRFYWISR